MVSIETDLVQGRQHSKRRMIFILSSNHLKESKYSRSNRGAALPKWMYYQLYVYDESLSPHWLEIDAIISG
jgi:hypothetical protein